MKNRFSGSTRLLRSALSGILYLNPKSGNKVSQRSKTILLTFLFLGITILGNAQPLPHSTPNGNPVPADALFFLLPMVLMAIGIFKLRKKGARR